MKDGEIVEISICNCQDVFGSRNGKEVVLIDARRLWYWDGAASLSELAMRGTSKPENCKFPCPVKCVELLEAIEILDTTDEAEKSIRGVPIWTQFKMDQAKE